MKRPRPLYWLVLMLGWAACTSSPSGDDEALSERELSKAYVDSVCAVLHGTHSKEDSSLALAEKAIAISEFIHYEQGAARSSLEKAKILSRRDDIESSDLILNRLIQAPTKDSLLYGEAHFFLGGNRRRELRHDAADSLMRIAQRYGRNNHSMLLSIGMNLGSSRSVERDYRGAMEELKKVESYLYTRTETGDSADYYNLYGTCMAFTGQAERGLALMEQALEMYRRDGDSTSLGRVSMSLFGMEMLKGDLDRALDRLQYAIDLHPMHGDTLLLAKYLKNQGLVLRELGRYDEALASYWQAHRYMELAGDENGLVRTKISIGSLYETLEDNRASIACLQEAAGHPAIGETPVTLATCKINLARLFRETGEPDEALALCLEAAALMGEKGDPMLRGRTLLELGRTYLARGEMNPARRHFEMVLEQAGKPEYKALSSDAHLALANLDLAAGNPAMAREHARAGIDSMGSAAHASNLMEAHLILAEAGFAMGDVASAVKNGTRAWELARDGDDQGRQRQISGQLSTFHEANGDWREALAFSRIQRDLDEKYRQAENEKAIGELRAQMDLDRKNSEIAMLSSQNLIQTEKLNNRKLLIGLLVVLAAGLVMFFFFWQKRLRLIRKNELLQLNVRHAEDRLRLENEMVEMRLLALQARLNPHFVFNCLVVLQNLTRRGDLDTALDYLRDFSRLTRMVFDISQKPSLSLSEEVEFLELYTKLENKRLRSGVELKVKMSPDIDPEEVFIPPLLLQPILENCFKHGFADNREDKHIELQFDLKEDGLFCSVTDNGKGIGELKEHNRPSGIRITRKRLTILSGRPDESRSLLLYPGLNGIGARAEFFIPMVHA